MRENNIYSDLDLAFIPHPLTGDLEPKLNQEALKRAVRNLFYTNAFDIPFNATTKSSLKRYLFEDNNQITRASLEQDLRWIIKKMEPRIEVKGLDIVSAADGRVFDITLTYMIKSLNQDDSFNFTVERVR